MRTTEHSGTIAITDQVEAIVVIDDLDSPSWHGAILSGGTRHWEAGRVTVRLLEGQRAKHIAGAELNTDTANRVVLDGLTAFMPGAEE